MNNTHIIIRSFRPHQAAETSALINAVFDEFVGFEYIPMSMKIQPHE